MELHVQDGDGHPHTLEVFSVKVSGGGRAWSSPGEYLDNPPEPYELEYEAMIDGRPFTLEDYRDWQDTIDEAILNERG